MMPETVKINSANLTPEENAKKLNKIQSEMVAIFWENARYKQERASRQARQSSDGGGL